MSFQKVKTKIDRPCLLELLTVTMTDEQAIMRRTISSRIESSLERSGQGKALYRDEEKLKLLKLMKRTFAWP